MKYACLSDIHGNIEAFNACVKDAFQKGIDGFIFLGDYVTDFPFENEVLNKIQEIESNYPCYIIKGNREDNIIYQSQHHEYKIGSNEEVMLLTYYHMTQKNVDYITSLPDVLTVDIGKFKVSMSHRMEKAEEADIVMSGHTHLQSSIYDEGVLYINPGSVGENGDGRVGATYSIVTFGDKVEVEENIVEYDVSKVVDQLRSSYMSDLRDHWDKIMEQTLLTGDCYNLPYIKNMVTLAEKYGYNTDLDEIPKHIWDECYEITIKQLQDIRQKRNETNE